jgi:hypothetical protein
MEKELLNITMVWLFMGNLKMAISEIQLCKLFTLMVTNTVALISMELRLGKMAIINMLRVA